MKNIKLNLIATCMLFLAGCYVYQPPPAVVEPSPPPQRQPQLPPANYQTFYDELAPYGTWVSDPRYGYIWLPNEGPDFRPYVTQGYWAYSDAGWTWVSYYNWGWAPFHYGRWLSDPSYGWMWVPGNEWAPAWVTWGNYNGYYGWAPMAPGYQPGVAYYPPINYWCFTQPQYMGNAAWSDHYYAAGNERIYMGGNTYIYDVHSINYINNTNNYNSRIYNSGPRREEIENITRTPIQTVRVVDNNSPARSSVNNGSLNIYRPSLSSSSRAAETAKPSTVVPIENVKQGQRAPINQQERTPQINNESNPSAHPASRQGETREPVITPQQQTPRQNNFQGGQPARENEPAITPQQQQQTPRQGNYQTPQPTRQQTATPSKQQQQQQGKGTTKRGNKQPKQPTKPKPAEKASPAEQSPPEKR